MPYFYLTFCVLFVASESIVGGFFNRKNEGKKGGPSLYSLLILCSVFTFWTIMFCTERRADIGVVPYSIAFALFYALGTVFFIRALKVGPVLLTSLIMQLSTIAVSIWGFFFWERL